jgi:uncharacterized protein
MNSFLEQGIKAFELENYTEALNLLLPLAKSGEIEAQCHVGCMYDLGLGIKSDTSEAIKWYLLAAESGHPVAQNNLALLMRYSENKPDEAAKWYRLAAEQGLPFAEVKLGEIYAQGLGVNRDYEEALKWYMKAAHKGFPIAYHYLGDAYLNGIGVSQDEKKAFEWYLQAAEQNYTPSQEILCEAYNKGMLGLDPDPIQSKYWFDRAKNNSALN